jgi:hypothetical protein
MSATATLPEKPSEKTLSSVEEIYDRVLRPLSAAARLKIAALILNDLAPQDAAPKVDYSDEWSDEDLRDFKAASWNYICARLDEEEKDA